MVQHHWRMKMHSMRGWFFSRWFDSPLLMLLHAWLHARQFSSDLGNHAAPLHACMHPSGDDWRRVDAILVSCPCPPPGAEIGTALTYMSRSTWLLYICMTAGPWSRHLASPAGRPAAPSEPPAGKVAWLLCPFRIFACLFEHSLNVCSPAHSQSQKLGTSAAHACTRQVGWRALSFSLGVGRRRGTPLITCSQCKLSVLYNPCIWIALAPIPCVC